MIDPAGFALAEEVEDLRDAAARFARDVLAPGSRDHERAGCWPEEVRAVVTGFLEGTGCLARMVLLETLAMGDAGGLPAADRPGQALGAVSACPDRSLAASATDAVMAVGVGRLSWAPGSPPPRQVWVSSGDHLRLVEIAGEPEPVDALAFAASGGLTIEVGDGAGALGRGEPRDGADAWVLGEWRLPAGGGWAVRGRARLWAAAVAVGVGQAAFDATVAYTTERVVFGRPVAHHQANAFELAGLATGIHGARLAVRDAAAAFDAGDPDAGFWATEAWEEAVGAAVAMSEAGIQLLGGHGFLVDHLAEKRFREARMLGLLFGGRDAVLDDLAGAVLGVAGP